MTTFPILTATPSAIAGFLSIAPKSDVRYYLSGVYVEPDTGMMIATDGQVLLAHRTKARVADVAPFIIPRALLENVAKIKCAQVRISIQTDAVARHRLVMLETGNGEGKGTSFEPDGRTFTFAEIDGCYPDWRRIVPRTVSGAATQLDPEKLLQAKEAMQAVCGEKRSRYWPVHVNPNGADQAAMITCSRIHTFAIVMPWRTDGSDFALTLDRFDLVLPPAPPAEVPAVAQAA
jgi:DNA polymerase-3 subunit beta